jgi:hypothetical protein
VQDVNEKFRKRSSSCEYTYARFKLKRAEKGAAGVNICRI